MDDHLSKPTNLQESGDKLERCGETETELARGRGYDAEDLLQRVGGDHFLLKEVIGIFLAESPELLSRLDRAVKNQDPEGLATTAHSLKGELGYLDAGSATDVARRLEEMGRAHDLTGAERLLAQLRAELSSLEPRLREVAEMVNEGSCSRG